MPSIFQPVCQFAGGSRFARTLQTRHQDHGRWLRSKFQFGCVLAKHCNQSVDRIAQETDRDKFFSAMEAKEFGLVDEVVEKK